MTRGNGSLIFEKPIFALILSHGTEGDKEEQGLGSIDNDHDGPDQ